MDKSQILNNYIDIVKERENAKEVKRQKETYIEIMSLEEEAEKSKDFEIKLSDIMAKLSEILNCSLYELKVEVEVAHSIYAGDSPYLTMEAQREAILNYINMKNGLPVRVLIQGRSGKIIYSKCLYKTEIEDELFNNISYSIYPAIGNSDYIFININSVDNIKINIPLRDIVEDSEFGIAIRELLDVNIEKPLKFNRHR